jgi:predicted PurR-regulated permease PerM
MSFLLTGAQDLLEMMGWSEQKKKKKPQRELYIELSPDERNVLNLLQQKEAVHIDEINLQISSFIRVQVLTSVIVSVATAAALWFLGVRQYVVWGLLAGVFNSIPYLGPIIVSGGLAVVAFMQFNDVGKTVTVSGVAFVITSLEGFLLTPALMSRAARMNPVAIFVGLLFWSWVWGVWGAVLAVPMLMMLKAVCDHLEDLQPIGELLGE